MNSHNEVGLAQTMLRVGGPNEAYEIRCARRSSAALRTAMHKEEDALRNRVECMEVTNESLTRALRDNGDVSAARLRRDLRTCAEQHEGVGLWRSPRAVSSSACLPSTVDFTQFVPFARAWCRFRICDDFKATSVVVGAMRPWSMGNP